MGTTGEGINTLGTSGEAVDRSIDDLLNRDGHGAEKLAELERLALLHQGLSTQGSTFRAQMMSLEYQVAELLGLEQVPAPLPPPPTPVMQVPLTVEAEDPALSASALSSVSTSSSVSPLSSPSGSVPSLTCHAYLAMLNEISKFSKKYIGAPITVNTWKAARPENEWLTTIQISDTGEFQSSGADFRLEPTQQDLLREWSVEFIRRSSKVLRNFEQMLKSAGVNTPD
jgi:hypothetical protein